MPRGVYKRKKKPGAPAKRSGGGEGSTAPFYQDLLTRMRVKRESLVDEVTALGTAIDALEALDER